MFDDAQANLSTFSPDRADHGRTLIRIGPMAFLFVSPPTRGIGRIRVFFAFFPPHFETSHWFQSPHWGGGYPVGGESHSHGAVGGDGGRYHTPSAIHAISSRSSPLYRFHATTESLGSGLTASWQTQSRCRPCTPSDTADSDAWSHGYIWFVQRNAIASHARHTEDSADLVGESASCGARLRPVRRRTDRELENLCL